MTFDAFKTYVADVLARLVKVCIQKRHTVAYASRVMCWAQERTRMIWDAFEARYSVQDAAMALYQEACEEL
jgi:hypothetical protein